MFELDDCMAFITSRSGKIFAEELERRLRSCELNRTHFIALHYICTRGPLVQCDLADLLGVKEPTVARMIQKLEADGYLERSGSPEDRRRRFIAPSRRGEEAYRAMLPIVEQFKSDTVAGISEDDLQTMKNVLAAMVKNAEHGTER